DLERRGGAGDRRAGQSLRGSGPRGSARRRRGRRGRSGMRSGVLSNIKRLVVPTGEVVRAIRAGPFRGLKMNLDLASQTQIYLGLFEREVYSRVGVLSAGIATAIDIGAAYGEYTL